MRIFFLSIITILIVSCSSKQNNNELFVAIKNNDTTAVIKLINSGTDLNSIHPVDSLSPICYAIGYGAMDVAQLLAQQDMVIKGITPDQNPVLMSLDYREQEFALMLINKNIDISMADKKGNQAIHFAAKSKKRDVVELLISKGANINVINKDGFTPLDFATIYKRESTMEMIKKLGGETFYKPLPDIIEGPFFKFSDDTIIGYYFKHNSESGKTFISDTAFSSEVTIVNGWDGDKSIYNISVNEKSDWNYTSVAKILAIGDIHGQYQRLVDNLKANGVIDDELNWIYGDAHLVFVGDIFDRGDKVTECLWLIQKLESQAVKANGMVHYLLGNHEKMILKNDIRYIAPKYYSLCYNSETEFKDIYDQNTFMGQWLRNKNAIVKIDDILFAHAGLSQTIADSNYSIQEINKYISDILYDRSNLKQESIDLLMRSEGPIWYRGYFRDTSLDVKSILSKYNANYIVVGHTEVDTLNFINNYPVIGINIPLWNKNVPNQALLIENGKFYRVINGIKKEHIDIY